VRILATSDPSLQQKMVEYQDGMRTMVLDKAAKLEEQGWQNYKVAGH
jgi:phosphoribosylaminoimidazole carboxylase